ncbi:CarD family transcriptional regulator [Olsenella urininfantis]|uniref:CarD family transcriptional regulator n=1 Tax=Olsenella urininfantis TaxID=1871033 RepID=UPI0009869DD9|nr:CarD family transcriptional regulator [Olsenella urininfantis]
MYEVGEYIVHPGQGVCRVEEVVEKPQASYMLMPVAGRHPMRISYPVAGEDRLRPIVTRDEAYELIGDYSRLQPARFETKSCALEEQHFKNKIRRGSCRDSVRIAKTFLQRIEEIRARNKKPPVVYERILRQARDRSLDELSVALGISQDEVRELFESQMPKEGQVE